MLPRGSSGSDFMNKIAALCLEAGAWYQKSPAEAGKIGSKVPVGSSRDTGASRSSRNADEFRTSSEFSASVGQTDPTREAGKFLHDCPPTPNQEKKEKQHESAYIHAPTFWSLL